MPNNNNVQEGVAELLSLLEIQRVICVDDYYDVSVDSVKQLCIDLSPSHQKFASIRLLDGISFSDYPDEWSSLLAQRLYDLDNEQLTELHRQLVAIGDTQHISSPNQVAALFIEGIYRGLSPSDWETEKSELLKPGGGRTLFLFDQNLGKGFEDRGMRIIQEIFRLEDSEHVICGLLSSTFTPDEEYSKWKAFAAEYNVKRERFLLISKGHSSADDAAGMIKLIVLNRLCGSLKQSIREVLLDAGKLAYSKLDEIDIYDFEHMVFSTSRTEGVWEPDTLLRLYAIFHRNELLQLARNNATVLDTADKLRKTTDLGITNKAKQTSFARNVMSLERFEASDYLVQHHIPLDLGDIFETMTQNEIKRYILLAQPCDLMVRSRGERSGSNEGMFARIIVKPASVNLPNPQYYRLQYFSSDETVEYVIDFKRAFTINLMVLDLCVFNAEGHTKFTLGEPLLPGLIPSWKAHHSVVVKYFRKAIDRVKKYSDKIDLETKQLLIPASSPDCKFKPVLSTDLSCVDYGLKRSGRLRQPTSGEVLLKFAQFNSRAAFDHELDRETE